MARSGWLRGSRFAPGCRGRAEYGGAAIGIVGPVIEQLLRARAQLLADEPCSLIPGAMTCGRGELASPLGCRGSWPVDRRAQEVFPPDLSVGLIRAHQSAFAERAGRLSRHGYLDDPPPASFHPQVVAGGVGQGPHLGSADVRDASRRLGEDELHQVVRDLACVYGLAEETPRDDHNGQPVEEPQDPQNEIVELCRPQDGVRDRRALDYPLGLELYPVVRI